MKRKLSVIVSSVLAALLVTSSMCLGAAAEAGVTREVGSTTTLDSVKDGDTVDMSFTIYTDPSFEYFNSCNFDLAYDPALIQPYPSAAAAASTGDNGYVLSPISQGDIYRITISNLPMTGPGTDGYCCKVTVKMKVVDAAKLQEAGSTSVVMSLYKNDFAVMKDGKMLDGDSEGVSFTCSPMVLKVSGGTVAETWTVSFDANGGNEVAPVSVEKGKSVTLPKATRSGYTFTGWYSDASLKNKVSSPYTPTADVTLYAGWNKDSSIEPSTSYYTITFNSNGGSACDKMSVKNNRSVTLPTPTKSGYTFDGWYTESSLKNKVSSPYVPTKNITLYAGWTKVSEGGNNNNNPTIYTISFNTNGGSAVSPATVIAGNALTLPTPTKSGYSFAGWYMDAGLTNKISTATYTPAANTTLYAKWTANAAPNNGNNGGNNSGNNNNNNVPKTGLESSASMLLFVMSALIACAGVIVVVRYRKISRNK